MTKKKPYIDISKVPIKAKDWVTVVDRASEAEHNLQIEELLFESDELRQFQATVISSTDNDLKPLSQIEFTIFKNVDTQGMVNSRTVQAQSNKDPIYTTFNLEKRCVKEIKSFLDARMSNDFGALFKTVVKYLVAANILPGMTEKEAHSYVSKLMRKNKELFRSEGGWIFSLKATVDKPSLEIVSADQPRVVDLTKLVLGIKYILESGVIGPVKIVNKAND